MNKETKTVTLVLHPINERFDNDNGTGMTVWEFTPSHLPSLFRNEYKFLRNEGCSRRAARWHIHRMLAMIENAHELGWECGEAEMTFKQARRIYQLGATPWQFQPAFDLPAGYVAGWANGVYYGIDEEGQASS